MQDPLNSRPKERLRRELKEANISIYDYLVAFKVKWGSVWKTRYKQVFGKQW